MQKIYKVSVFNIQTCDTQEVFFPANDCQHALARFVSVYPDAFLDHGVTIRHVGTLEESGEITLLKESCRT